MGKDAHRESVHRAPDFLSWRPCAASVTEETKFIAGSRGFYSTLASRRSVPDDLRIERIGVAGKPAACRYVELRPDLKFLASAEIRELCSATSR